MEEIVKTDELIISKIYLIRGQKVMLDRDLADMYNVETKVLKQAVKRNVEIFPEHFMFELTKEENESLRSQFVTSKTGRGGARYLPMAFTEHGVLQLASVLKSRQAKQMSIRIIEVFVKMRKMILANKDILLKLEQIEKKIGTHDVNIKQLYQIIKELMQEKIKPLRPIGFKIKGNF